MLDFHHSADSLERLRAALDLQTIDPEEAQAVFGTPPIVEIHPIVGVDYDQDIGPILVRYDAVHGRAFVRAQSLGPMHSSYVIYDARPDVLKEGYQRAKAAFAQGLKGFDAARREAMMFARGGQYTSTLHLPAIIS